MGVENKLDCVSGTKLDLVNRLNEIFINARLDVQIYDPDRFKIILGRCA